MGAPTSPTLTQSGDSAEIAFGWTHAGTEDRFEVRYRRSVSDTWERAILAPKARFGSASPYSYVTGSRPGTIWNVRALEADGDVTSAVEATFSDDVDGTWLLPVSDEQVVSGDRAWMGRDTGSGARPQTRSEALIPSRQEAIATVGALHLEQGTLSGVLMDRHSLTADEWLRRLYGLIENQSSYQHILYVSKRVRMKVELYEIPDKTAIFLSDDAWQVSVNYRELA